MADESVPGFTSATGGGGSPGAPYADDPHLGDVIVSSEALAARISELGAEISRDYAGRAPLLVGVLTLLVVAG